MFHWKLKNEQGEVILEKSNWPSGVDSPWKEKLATRKGHKGLHDDIPAEIDEDGNEIAPALTKNYSLEVIDRSAEIAAQEAAEQARKDAAARLKALPQGAGPTPQIIEDILVHLGLK